MRKPLTHTSRRFASVRAADCHNEVSKIREREEEEEERAVTLIQEHLV